MLSERRRRVLRALVSEYVTSAHPVGSKALVDEYDLGCSAATVRNDLAALEESGHVFQPHVSAGRIPTDVGYRTFVDELRADLLEKGPTPMAVEVVRDHYRAVETELDELMHETAGLLSRLTSYAAIVLAPALRRSRVRRVDLVPLAPERVLVVLITDTGQVAKRMAELGEAVPGDELAQTERMLNEALGGRVAEELPEIRADLEEALPTASVTLSLADEILACLTEAEGDSLYHDGTAALLGQPEFADPEMVRSLVGLLEDGLVLARAISDAAHVKDFLVRIGGENRIEEMDHMSVVLAPYGMGEAEGLIGLLGPTRMDYTQAITTVRCVAGALSHTFEKDAE